MLKVELAPPIFGITSYTLADTEPSWFEVQNTDGIQSVKVIIEKKEDNQYKVKATGEMKFFNDEKDFILSHLITGLPPSYIPNNYVWIRIYDDCCGEYVFKGHITADLVKWCSGDCFVTCNAKEYTKRTDSFNFINNTLLSYDNVDRLDIQYRKRATKLSRRYHPSPLLKDLLIKNLALNNITFSSSILNNSILNEWTGDDYQDLNNINPYPNTYLVNADFEQGNKTTGGDFINNNKMIDTIKGLLDKLKDVYNADYWIREISGQKTLEFERKDYFSYFADEWKDLTSEDICYNIDAKSKYAFFEGKWQKNVNNDSDDQESYLVYNEIEEWNNPVNPLQTGRRAVNLSFSYAEIDVANSDYGQDDLNLDKTGLLSAPTLVIASKTLTSDGILATFYRMRNPSNAYYSPMYDALTGSLDIKAHEYNAPYWFSNKSWFKKRNYADTRPLVPYVYSLYDNFHFIDNPKNLPNGRGYYAKFRKFGLQWSVKMTFNCAEYLSFNETSGVKLNVNGTEVIAMIENAEFDFKTRELTLKGKV